MRAVALADSIVQDKVARSFIPLKITIPFGAEKFPVDWPGMKHWSDTYQQMGGKKVDGITGCSVISLDLKTEYGNTGSAFVWELFDSIAYDEKKFAAMLDRSLERFGRDQKIRADKSLSEKERERNLATFHAEVRKAMGNEGQFYFPPKGFTIEGAKELFRLSGDLKDGGGKGKDKDKQAKPPTGTWKRIDGKTTVVITFTDKAATVSVKSEKFSLAHEADYSLSKNKILYACIRKVKEGDERVTGELFGFDYEVGDDELDLTRFRGTGAVALGGFFMNGKYKKESPKKD